MPHFMIVLILYMNLLNLSWIKIKMSIFEEYGAFNPLWSGDSADPDQTMQNAVSDQGLHCLQVVQPFFSQNN